MVREEHTLLRSSRNDSSLTPTGKIFCNNCNMFFVPIICLDYKCKLNYRTQPNMFRIRNQSSLFRIDQNKVDPSRVLDRELKMI